MINQNHKMAIQIEFKLPHNESLYFPESYHQIVAKDCNRIRMKGKIKDASLMIYIKDVQSGIHIHKAIFNDPESLDEFSFDEPIALSDYWIRLELQPTHDEGFCSGVVELYKGKPD